MGKYAPGEYTNSYNAGSEHSLATSGCSVDVRIRAAGYVIYARPRDSEPVWCLGDKKYRQSDVLILLDLDALVT